MSNLPGLGKIDLHLVTVLHTVITEGSVSRAAGRWLCQPVREVALALAGHQPPLQRRNA